MQSIVQARMPDADPLLTLGLNREAVSRLGSRTLPDLQRLSLQRLNGELSDTELAGLKEALAQLPLLQVLAERKHDHIHLDLRCNKRLQFGMQQPFVRRRGSLQMCKHEHVLIADIAQFVPRAGHVVSFRVGGCWCAEENRASTPAQGRV